LTHAGSRDSIAYQSVSVKSNLSVTVKTTLLVVTVLAGACCGARAQGTIFWGNNNSTRISTNSFFGGPATGLTAAAANLYYYALFYSTNATTVEGTTNAQSGFGVYAFEDPNWTFAAYGTNSSLGRFFPSAQNADSSTTVNGVSAGASAQFVVVGWSANMGSTLAQMESAFFLSQVPGSYVSSWLGESAVSGPLQLGDGGVILPPNLFGNSSPQISGFTLGYLAPEPSSLALAVVGLAGLFFFRRRRV
jgi:PEP-CTERM motif